MEPVLAEKHDWPRQHSSISNKNEIIKIMVVEDDRSQWPIWENVLTSIFPSDCEIDWITSGECAQALLREAFINDHPYNLVISDVYLEGEKTGVDLWNRYGEITDTFIFTSGIDSAKELLLKIKNGHPPFLQKPLNIKNCKKVIQELLINKEDL